MIDPNILHSIIPIARAAEEAAAPSGIAGTFGIDWMKFIAQLLNVGIALFVLWKWVFTPVTKKLEERTAKIEKAMHDAHATEKEKQEFEKWRQEEMAKARKEASSIVTAAQTDATKTKDQILHQAKEEQQKLVDQAQKQIEQEKNQQLQSAKAELADLVTNAAEKILRSKLDPKKDEQLIKESLSGIN